MLSWFLLPCIASLPDRLNNFEVRVGNTKPSAETMGSNPLCIAVAGALPGGPTQLSCAGGVSGRYLTIQLMGNEALCVCEVTVDYQSNNGGWQGCDATWVGRKALCIAPAGKGSKAHKGGEDVR